MLFSGEAVRLKSLAAFALYKKIPCQKKTRDKNKHL